jgi:very-short-patch-repair endonuclease
MGQHFPQQLTSIERALKQEFDVLGLSYVMHQSLFGRFQPDFTFNKERLFVQADGDYWHSLPKQIKQDAAFDAAALQAGWTVLRFKGSVIKEDVHKCIQQVVALLKGTNQESPLAHVSGPTKPGSP